MSVPFSRASAAAVVLFILTGCSGVATRRTGAPPPPRTPVATARKVVYVIPRSPDIITTRSEMMTYGGRPGAVAHGVTFIVNEVRETDSTGYGSHTIRGVRFAMDRESNVLQVFRFEEYVVHTSNKARWLGYTKYFVDVAADDQADRIVVTLTPKEIEVKKDGTLGKVIAPPAFSEEELGDELVKARVAFKLEMDSPYGKDAIIANFKRVLGAPPLEEQEKGRSGANKTSFKLAKEKYTAYLSLETWPYRNGTKTIVTVDTTVWPASSDNRIRTIDVQKVIDAVRHDVEGILTS